MKSNIFTWHKDGQELEDSLLACLRECGTIPGSPAQSSVISLLSPMSPYYNIRTSLRHSVQSGWHEGLIETGPFWVVAVMQIIINMMNKATNMNSKLIWVMVQSCIYALTLLHIHRTWCAHLCECLFPPLPWGGNSINQRSWNTWRCKYQELWDVEFVPKTAVLFNTQT